MNRPTTALRSKFQCVGPHSAPTTHQRRPIILMAGLGGSFLMLNSTVVAVLDTHTVPDMRGTVLGFYTLAQTAGFSIGGQLVGLFADATSTPWAFFICGSICTVVALVFILFPRHSVDSLSIQATKT